MKNEILNALKTVQTLVSNPGYETPLYVRLRTTTGRLMVGINSITIDDTTIRLIDDQKGEIIIEVADVTAVEAFKDSVGRSIFLKDFESESTLASDYINENELLTQIANREAGEWQELMLDAAGIDKEISTDIISSSDKSKARNIRNEMIANQIEYFFESWQALRAA